MRRRLLTKQEAGFWAQNGDRGSASVYLVLGLVVIMSLILAFLEAARSEYVTAYSNLSARTAASAVMGEYYRPLFDRYGILALDTGFGSKRSNLGRLNELLVPYIGDDFLGAECEGMTVCDLYPLLSAGEEEFIAQVVEQEKLDSVKFAVERLLGMADDLAGQEEVAGAVNEKIRLEEEFAGIDLMALEIGSFLRPYPPESIWMTGDYYVTLIVDSYSPYCEAYIGEFEDYLREVLEAYGRARDVAGEAIKLTEALVPKVEAFEEELNRLAGLVGDGAAEGLGDTLAQMKAYVGLGPGEARDYRKVLDSLNHNIGVIEAARARLYPPPVREEAAEEDEAEEAPDGEDMSEEASAEGEAHAGETAGGNLSSEDSAEGDAHAGDTTGGTAGGDPTAEGSAEGEAHVGETTGGTAGGEPTAEGTAEGGTAQGDTHGCSGLTDEEYEEAYARWAQDMLDIGDSLGDLTERGLSMIYEEGPGESMVREVKKSFGKVVSDSLLSIVLKGKEGDLSDSSLCTDFLPSIRQEITMAAVESALAAVGRMDSRGVTASDTLGQIREEAGLGQLSRDLAGKKAGRGEQVDSTLRKLLLAVYARSNFSCLTDYKKAGRGPLCYELEYILCGDPCDKVNLASAASKLLMTRMLPAMVYVVTDKKISEEAAILAGGALGWTGMPFLVKAAQYTILTIWAAEQAAVEVAALMRGKTVGITTTKSSFCISEADLLAFSGDLVKSKAETFSQPYDGLTYKDYLTLLLLAGREEETAGFTLDLIQENIRQEYDENFLLQNCVVGFEVRGRFGLDLKWLPEIRPAGGRAFGSYEIEGRARVKY